jgi:hypothetical protein
VAGGSPLSCSPLVGQQNVVQKPPFLHLGGVWIVMGHSYLQTSRAAQSRRLFSFLPKNGHERSEMIVFR